MLRILRNLKIIDYHSDSVHKDGKHVNVMIIKNIR